MRPIELYATKKSRVLKYGVNNAVVYKGLHYRKELHYDAAQSVAIRKDKEIDMKVQIILHCKLVVHFTYVYYIVGTLQLDFTLD